MEDYIKEAPQSGSVQKKLVQKFYSHHIWLMLISISLLMIGICSVFLQEYQEKEEEEEQEEEENSAQPEEDKEAENQNENTEGDQPLIEEEEEEDNEKIEEEDAKPSFLIDTDDLLVNLLLHGIMCTDISFGQSLNLFFSFTGTE